MTVCKVFVIGPHSVSRYKKITEIVNQAFSNSRSRYAAGSKMAFASVEVSAPNMNPTRDQFQDWNLSQIDTATFVVVDATRFNPNVMYEIAFAHSIGVPLIYFITVKSQAAAKRVKIPHYLQFSLVHIEAEEDFNLNSTKFLSTQLEEIFVKGELQGSNVLSRYYGGVPPIDAEFTRGLAQTYYNNFLAHVLNFRGDVSHVPKRVAVIIPDTLEVAAREVSQMFTKWADTDQTDFAIEKNVMNKPLTMKRSQKLDLLYDIPTILFTLRNSSRYRNLSRMPFISSVDRDRVADTMVIKFVGEFLRLRDENQNLLGDIDGRLEIRWLSEFIPNWTDARLLSQNPLPQPRRVTNDRR